MENQKKEGSDVLLGLSHVFEGDVEAIIDIVVKKREKPPFNIVSIKESLHSNYITILDEGFPKRFTNYFRPPMVMYYKGDISLLQDADKNISLLNSKTTCNYATESLLNIVTGLDTTTVIAVVVPVTDGGMQLASRVMSSGFKIIAVSDKALDSNNYSEYQSEVLQAVLQGGGLVLSEIPDHSNNKSKKHYLMRLISLCASNVLVGAIAKKDVLIHGVAISLQLGNDVFCIPFNIGSNYINNELIRDGAFLVQESTDVLLRHHQ